MIGFASLNTTRHASNIQVMYSGGPVLVVTRYDPSKCLHSSQVVGVPPMDSPIVPGESHSIFASANGTLSYYP